MHYAFYSGAKYCSRSRRFKISDESSQILYHPRSTHLATGLPRVENHQPYYWNSLINEAHEQGQLKAIASWMWIFTVFHCITPSSFRAIHIIRTYKEGGSVESLRLRTRGRGFLPMCTYAFSCRTTIIVWSEAFLMPSLICTIVTSK